MEDPLGFEAGINFYAYVNNNPVNYNDPTGYAANPKKLDNLIKAFGSIKELAAAKARSAANRVDDLTKPGPYNDVKISATGAKATMKQRLRLKELGGGCHHCGSKVFGTKDNVPIGDHQRPTALKKVGEQQFLHPHCIFCSASQGGFISGIVRRAKNFAKDTKELFIGVGVGLGMLWDSPEARASFAKEAGALTIDLLDPGFMGDMADSTLTSPSHLDYINNYSHNFSSAGGASGGYVIYPSKANTNMMRQVYSK